MTAGLPVTVLAIAARTPRWNAVFAVLWRAMPLAPGTRPWPSEVTVALEQRASSTVAVR